ncbi:MAG: acyl-CoA dehydrogenase family protein [Cyanobacteria bacterium J06623_7]
MVSDRPTIEAWLKEIVSPLANEIDGNRARLRRVLQQMGDRSWLAMKAPVELGGMGLKEVDYRSLQITLARTSGALTFLQTQHQSAVSKLAQSPNQALQRQFFPGVAKGEPLIGVGFSHLRRLGQPAVRATETSEGYLISGKVPWITGYGYFDWFILGATLADGRELYGLLPLQNATQKNGSIACSQPMELLAAAATDTVSATIDRWLLSRDRLVSINPPGAIHQSSRQNILNHGFYALGCAYAGLDILQGVARGKQLKFIASSWQTLFDEVRLQEMRGMNYVANGQTTYAEKLEFRTAAIDLAQRCSLAAVVASSGAANYLHSSAGRVYREALLFSVSGQTTDVMANSLKRLTVNGKP